MTLSMTMITDEESNTNIMPRGSIKINFNITDYPFLYQLLMSNES